VNRSTLRARAFGPLGRLFDLRGRTARRDFWPYMLLLFVSWLVGGATVLTLFGIPPSMIIFLMTMPSGWFVPADALFLPFILLGFAAIVRRLHDIEVNALPVIAYVLLYGASVGCFQLLAHHSTRIGAEVLPMMLLGLPGLLVSVCFVALIVMCSQAGTRGPNRYGPDPREAAGT
jgi:uncharacterized membrane protein YhaH (DUF805 family)